MDVRYVKPEGWSLAGWAERLHHMIEAVREDELDVAAGVRFVKPGPMSAQLMADAKHYQALADAEAEECST